jgi:hypothetical protein
MGILGVVYQVRTEFHDSSSPHHIHVIVGLVLLQTISLLRREGERAAPPNTRLHAMLVAVSFPSYQGEFENQMPSHR